jgi:hypothetical protein
MALLEEAMPAAIAFPEWPVVEGDEQLGDGLIQFGEREESALSNGGNNPRFHHLNTGFDLGLRLATGLYATRDALLMN